MGSGIPGSGDGTSVIKASGIGLLGPKLEADWGLGIEGTLDSGALPYNLSLRLQLPEPFSEGSESSAAGQAS